MVRGCIVILCFGLFLAMEIRKRDDAVADGWKCSIGLI